MVLIYNPMPKTMHHYAREFCETIDRIGLTSETLTPSVPLDGEGPHLRRAISHVRAAVKVGRRRKATVAVWPSLGWIEAVLWRITSARASIIMHDPEVLRRQFFMGRRSASLSSRFTNAHWICHTHAAVESVLKQTGSTAALAYHPILTNAKGSPRTVRPRVAVLGQYKPARDIDILVQLAKNLKGSDYDLTITGRGWPPVDGWHVEDRFLSEAELDSILSESSAVVLPYSVYWQSGIAIRAVEHRTHVVGKPTEFLTTLMGADYPGLVRDGAHHAWADAVHAVISAGPCDAHERYRSIVDESWRLALATEFR